MKHPFHVRDILEFYGPPGQPGLVILSPSLNTGVPRYAQVGNVQYISLMCTCVYYNTGRDRCVGYVGR